MLKKAPYGIHPDKRVRLIIDTDAGCEADDLFAIAQALMTPKFEVRAICAEHFTEAFVSNSMEASYKAALDTLEAMGLQGSVPVLRGSPRMPGPGAYERSEASDFIVQEALREDSRPLYVVLLGAVSNVAAALLTRPEIAGRLVLIGGKYPDGQWFFNSCNDHHAYNVLLDSSAEWWTVDLPMGIGMQASMMQLHNRVRPCGEIGRLLYERTLWAVRELTARIGEDRARGRMGAGISDLAYAAFMPTGENWSFWDCAMVGLAIYDQLDAYVMKPAPLLLDERGTIQERPGNPRLLRCYHRLDTELIMNDFYEKLAHYFGPSH